MDKQGLHNMYNATSTDGGKGEIETYEAWLERELIGRIHAEAMQQEPKFVNVYKDAETQGRFISDENYDTLNEALGFKDDTGNYVGTIEIYDATD